MDLQEAMLIRPSLSSRTMSVLRIALYPKIKDVPVLLTLLYATKILLGGTTSYLLSLQQQYQQLPLKLTHQPTPST